MLADEVLIQLARTDERLARVGASATLSPEREHATRLSTLGEQLFGRLGSTQQRAACDCVCSVVESQLEHFPDTLFWDFDYWVAEIAHSSARAGETATQVLAQYSALVCRVQARFGRHSPLRFRYAHDFVYGYDWAKWVLRAPEKRQAVQPYDSAFLLALDDRGKELIALVERGDATYGRLHGAEFRNPFPFSREPGDEQRLHASLAKANLIPVRTWLTDAAPVWNRRFHDLRVERAQSLGRD